MPWWGWALVVLACWIIIPAGIGWLALRSEEKKGRRLQLVRPCAACAELHKMHPDKSASPPTERRKR